MRVVTYNIHHGVDARVRPSLDAIADTLAAVHPDVVMLQEVDRKYGARSGHLDQVAELSDRLDMYGHFSTSVSNRSGQYGNALLSAQRPLHTDSILLPADGIEQRSAALARLPTAAGPITTISTHLTVGLKAQQYRQRQLRELVRIISAKDEPVIIGGDFNTAAAFELAELEKTLTRARHHVRHKWIPRPATATFPAGWPVRRIDRIYVSPQLRVRHVQVLNSRASDHRPFLADIAVGASQR